VGAAEPRSRHRVSTARAVFLVETSPSSWKSAARARTSLGPAAVPGRCGVEVVEGGATLVIAGSEGPPGLRSVARILAAVLPDARFVELDGSGHVTHPEMPDEFAAAVAAFAAEIQIDTPRAPDRHTESTRARRSPSRLVTAPPRR
jgi:pimeloyl-ACP methyl ester carboxylesterase